MRTRLLILAGLVAGFPTAARAEEEPPAPPSLETLQQEIAELRATVEALETAAAGAGGEVPALRLYGWIDAGIQKSFANGNALFGAVSPSDATTFVLGNINLYIDIQPVDKWSALVELRFTTAPDGADFAGTAQAGPYHVTSTTITDPTSPNGGWQRLRWGAISLERAYVQYAASDHLTLRVGTWLTPYGIWNVDHGLPTRISMMVPQGNVVEMLPPRQTGLQLLGKHHFGAWTVHYTGTISNGRDPTRLDPTEEKAFGGRLVLERSGVTRLAVGASFYAGHYEEQRRDVIIVPSFQLERSAVIAYDEQGVGVDASLDVGPLRLRTEATFHRAVYDEGKRETVYGVPGIYWPDRHDLDWYTLAAYRLPWAGLEPFVSLDWMRWPTFMGEGVLAPSAGLNVNFTAAAQLKLQYTHVFFWGDDEDSPGVGLFAARAVVAF